MNKKSSGVFVYLEVTLMAASLLSPHKERMDLATALVWMAAAQGLSPFSYHYSNLALQQAGTACLELSRILPSHASVCLTFHSAITLSNPTIFDLFNKGLPTIVPGLENK